MTARQIHRTFLAFAALTVLLGFAFLITPTGVSAGEVREADPADSAVPTGDLAVEDDPEEWPQCYSESIGWHVCTVDEILSNFPDEFFEEAEDGRCPDGYVFDRRTGKCINDQLTVPDPVPADDRSAVIVQTQMVEFDPDLFGCPEGWVAATPPLNWQLGCLPNTIVAEG